MFRNFIITKLNTDERNGIYVAPNLPAVKLGKILIKERRISQPGDVAAIHLDEGIFSDTFIILTTDTCYYPNGSFPIAEVKTAEPEGRSIHVVVNRLGSMEEHRFKTGNEIAARNFSRVLEEAPRHLVRQELESAEQELKDYSQFEGKELDWLKMRDEVMKTIDLLHEKFNEGKISLIQYEEKKDQLLARL